MSDQDVEVSFEGIAASLDKSAAALAELNALFAEDAESPAPEIYRVLANQQDALVALVAMIQLMAGAQP